MNKTTDTIDESMSTLIAVQLILYSLLHFEPHQWPSDSALKPGRREVPASIPGRACRPRCSEFSVVFSETRVNTG